MLKNFIALLVTVATLSSHALAPMSSANELEKAFNKLHFSLTTKWDGKDKAYYNAKKDAFKVEVRALQKKGLTNEQLLNFSKSKIQDKQVAADFDKMLKVIEADKLTQKEANELIVKNLSKNYKQGASWSGSGNAVLWAVIIVALMLAAAGSSSSSCDNYYEDYVCYDYYDDWGEYWYTDCSWETYCY